MKIFAIDRWANESIRELQDRCYRLHGSVRVQPMLDLGFGRVDPGNFGQASLRRRGQTASHLCVGTRAGERNVLDRAVPSMPTVSLLAPPLSAVSSIADNLDNADPRTQLKLFRS